MAQRRRMNQNRDEGQSGLISERLLADLRGLCFTWPGKNGDFKELAAEAGISPQTIQNLCFMNTNGKQTQRPHFETVARLLMAFKRLDLLEAAFQGEHKPIQRGKKKK